MWPFLIPTVGTICTFAFVIMLTLSQARVRELEVREPIAMIERKLVPPPEVDPRGFDRALPVCDRRRHRGPGRFRRAGVTLMGIGLGPQAPYRLPARSPRVELNPLHVSPSIQPDAGVDTPRPRR